MSGKTSDLYVVGMLGSPETWMVPEAAVSNPARSSRRCSSPSTVDSAARRACYDQPGLALPGGRAAALRVRGPNLGGYADSLVAKAQVRATLATISDDATCAKLQPLISDECLPEMTRNYLISI